MSEQRPLAAANVTPEEDDMQRIYLRIEIDGVTIDQGCVEHRESGLAAWKDAVKLAALWLMNEHPESVARFKECISLSERAFRGEISYDAMVDRTKELMRDMDLPGISDADLPVNGDGRLVLSSGELR